MGMGMSMGMDPHYQYQQYAQAQAQAQAQPQAPPYPQQMVPAPPPTPAPAPAAPAPAPASGLSAEQAWLQAHPGAGSLHVAVPADPASAFNFAGQSIPVPFDSLAMTVRALKDALTPQLGGLPAAKMKVCVRGGVFLNKDDLSLAHYNVLPGAVLEVGLRTRGGRK
jgi:hypothetical protein